MCGKPRYGSDVVVEILRGLGIKYASLNPGSSFRGLHESLVNFGGNNSPEIIECNHEEIAVQIAHGYAKVEGKPMVCILHNVVGLLHGMMAIYYAYIDEVPIIILGGTGPMDAAKRRPGIDWIHTALLQGNVVREFVKWDDQPFSVESMVESLIRAYKIAMTEPKGPVYVCLDILLQEEEASYEPSINYRRFEPPQTMSGSDEAIAKAAEMVCNASFPVILADRVGRNPSAVDELVSLAEELSIPVVDLGSTFNFPNNHPLDLTGSDVISRADLIIAIDVPNLNGALTRSDLYTRESKRLSKSDATIISIGISDLKVRGGVLDYYKLEPVDLTIIGSSSLIIPRLKKLCKEMMKSNYSEMTRARLEEIKDIRRKTREKWMEEVKRRWDERPVSPPRLAAEIWEVIKNEDWVLCTNTLNGWARRIWVWDKPSRYPGRGWGTSTHLGISLGIALSYRQSNKVVVDIQPDGDLLYNLGALWTASHNRLPIFIVMHNNKAYWNDWAHQEYMAKIRGRGLKNVRIGVEIDNPPVDYAAAARAMGLNGYGPVEDPSYLGEVIREAFSEYKEKRVPTLVDVICAPR